MAQPTKPTETVTKLEFASGASGATQIEQPDASHRTGTGWYASEKPRHTWFNYLMKWYYQYINYFYNCIEDVYTTIATLLSLITTLSDFVSLSTGNTTHGYIVGGINITGFSDSVTTDCYYKLNTPDSRNTGWPKTVELYIKKISNSTSNSTSMGCSAGTLPTSIRPVIGYRIFPCMVIDNNYANIHGSIRVDSDGSILFMKGIISSDQLIGGSTTFTGGNTTKGFDTIYIKYTI
jgi:hypothetical protein